jgi:hypothetical protein
MFTSFSVKMTCMTRRRLRRGEQQVIGNKIMGKGILNQRVCQNVYRGKGLGQSVCQLVKQELVHGTAPKVILQGAVLKGGGGRGR